MTYSVNFNLTPQQNQMLDFPLQTKTFLHGQFGTGKSTFARLHFQSLIDQGISPESILVLVPQRSLSKEYFDLIRSPEFEPGEEPTILTIGGLAQRSISLFWPAIAKLAGFSNSKKNPQFLTLETAQYYLGTLVEPLLRKGYFESVVIETNRLYSQILDNLNKSAVVGFPPEEISARLTHAWSGKPTQAIIYEQAQECALLFRQFCLDNNFLDFSLQLSTFRTYLWDSLLCKQYLIKKYRHLIYDNAEEDYPVAHDLIKDWLNEFDSALIICDDGAGFRSFMGADPLTAFSLANECDHQIQLNTSFIKTDGLNYFEKAISTSLIQHRIDETISNEASQAFSVADYRFYPQLMDAISRKISDLIIFQNTAPGDIVVLTPFLSDSLRFSFTEKFRQENIPVTTFRPSRSLNSDPSIKTALTWAKIAFKTWQVTPTRDEIRSALMLSLDDCDFIRADLLTQMLYKPASETGPLLSFDPVNKEMQNRISFTVGTRYEALRKWLMTQTDQNNLELDIFFSRFFGEILSYSGYRFHRNHEAAAAISRLIESARKFRQVLTKGTQEDGFHTGKEFVQLVEKGFLSAQYLSDYSAASQQDTVLISPAFSYLMSNHPVRYQFWLDIGSNGWWSRLDQPLTHPYVLSRQWNSDQLWTDVLEVSTNLDFLAKVTTGLIRRCRDQIFLCSVGINERGEEERGPLIMAVQTILRKLRQSEGGENV